MYYCKCCGCGFDYEDLRREEINVGEAWGVSCYIVEVSCPLCRGEVEEEEICEYERKA